MTHPVAIDRDAAPLLRGDAATLWDLGDGVACFETTTKMGTLDPDVFALLDRAVALVAASWRALVIHHDGRHFSAGANLNLFLRAAREAAWDRILAVLVAGQRSLKAMKYAPFPVVAAPFGLALGGGCEMVLHADAVQAHADLSIGLVECGVGLIPGWGGCGEMLRRLPDPAAAFARIAGATVATGAEEARRLGFLRPADGISADRATLLTDAKARALALAGDYAPPAPPLFTLPGAAGRPAMLDVPERPAEPGAHDGEVAAALARVLCGGDAPGPVSVDEAGLLALERDGFMRLVRTAPTQDRIAHTLATGRMLRN